MQTVIKWNIIMDIVSTKNTTPCEMKHPFFFHLSRVRVLLAGRDTVHATTTTIFANFEMCALHMQRTVQIHKRSIFCAPCGSTVLIYYNNNSKLGWKLAIQRRQFKTRRRTHCSKLKQWTFMIISL